MKKCLIGLLFSASAIVAISGDAFASDITPAASDWTGIYVGVGGGGTASFSNTDATGYGWAIGEPCNEFIDGGTDFGGGCTLGEFGHISQVGDGYATSDAAYWLNEILNNAPFSDPKGGDGETGAVNAFGTLEGGADYQFGNKLVVGVNAGFNFGKTEIKNSSSEFIYNDPLFEAQQLSEGTLETEVELGNSWSLGGRLGYLVTDNLLAFVSAGYVSTEAKLTASFDARSNFSFPDYSSPQAGGGVDWSVNSTESDWLNGHYFGGGAEMLVSDNFSVKLEYRYSNLGSIETAVDYFADDFEGAASAGVGAKAEPVTHAVSATLNYRF